MAPVSSKCARKYICPLSSKGEFDPAPGADVNVAGERMKGLFNPWILGGSGNYTT